MVRGAFLILTLVIVLGVGGYLLLKAVVGYQASEIPVSAITPLPAPLHLVRYQTGCGNGSDAECEGNGLVIATDGSDQQRLTSLVCDYLTRRGWHFDVTTSGAASCSGQACHRGGHKCVSLEPFDRNLWVRDLNLDPRVADALRGQAVVEVYFSNCCGG